MTAPDLAALARAAVEAVDDPELPCVTIGDLGMVYDVSVGGGEDVTATGGQVVDAGVVRVTLLPTYTGCPATEQIREDVAAAVAATGARAEVRFVLAPAWTTARISEAGRRKLAEAGIAPPSDARHGAGHAGAADDTAVDVAVELARPVACPRCGSRRTRRLGEFGATACKAPHVCDACREPFESFKPL